MTEEVMKKISLEIVRERILDHIHQVPKLFVELVFFHPIYRW
jgi:hypothetical protein